MRSWNITPIISSSFLNIKRGRKVQIVVSVEPRIAANISRLPRIAAIALFSPLRRNEYVFSRMMIDASTIMPIPRMSPAMLILFTESPKTAMNISVIRIQIGIESEIMIVDLIPRRKRKMTRAANITP